MPFPLPPRAPSGLPRRRTLLASAAGAALLAGCSSGPRDSGGSGKEEESAGGSPSVTERARARAARESHALVERYDAVLAAHPALTERLTPLRAEVVRHMEAFGGTPTASPTPSSAAPSSAMPSSSAPSPSSSAPVSAKEAIAALAAAERTLADSRAAALLDVPGELARLLASVAAAGAAHAYLLTEGAR
ncbi:hypothetical protein [Streptomyces antibioticus]|uniref:Lipoprotein n=1 Tax=Streptomyces antibioticus TaxID=1890 RepID=A0AAE6YDU1_STRAT|nr:hypothetical protein [Streptomyces antibioticus]OOQ48828.1 hypothetical protein AFM16_27910 [Streptomyces antibioticus]QIT46967.1 hypothetical protein HCX60_28410 [Streptomyces antibioticus]